MTIPPTHPTAAYHRQRQPPAQQQQQSAPGDSFIHQDYPSYDADYHEVVAAHTNRAGLSMEEEPFPGEEEPIPVADQSYQVETVNDSVEEAVYPFTDKREGSPPLRETTANSRRQPTTTPRSTFRSTIGLPTPTRTTTPTTSTPLLSNRSRLLFRSKIDTTIDDEATQPAAEKSPREAVWSPKFKELHEKTMKRRQNQQKNMMTLERGLASITSSLANITMDRDAQNCDYLKTHVSEPMKQAAERLAMEQEQNFSPAHLGTKHWMALTARLSQLETDVAQQIHVMAPQLIREELDQPHNVLTQQIVPTVYAETTQSEKREGFMFRQFEDVAGTARRRYHEERASRHGSFEVVRQQLLEEAKLQSDPQRIEDAIVKVRALRAKLEQERVERRMRDEHLKTAIEQEVISMRRAMLEATGGDDIVVPEQGSVGRAIMY